MVREIDDQDNEDIRIRPASGGDAVPPQPPDEPAPTTADAPPDAGSATASTQAPSASTPAAAPPVDAAADDTARDADATPRKTGAAAGRAWRATRDFLAQSARTVWRALEKITVAAGNERVDAGLEKIRNWVSPDFIAKLLPLIARAGRVALTGGVLLTMLLFLLGAIRLSSLALLAQGLTWTALLAVLSYSAACFTKEEAPAPATQTAVSPSFLNSMALVFEIVGLLLFVRWVVQAAAWRQWSMAFAGLAALLVGDLLFILSLHPPLLGLRARQEAAAPGEPAGILDYALGLLERGVPAACGLGVMAGVLGLLVATLETLFMTTNPLMPVARFGLPGMTALRTVACFAALPLAGYMATAVLRWARGLRAAA
jgi:hypothetical protein